MNSERKYFLRDPETNMNPMEMIFRHRCTTTMLILLYGDFKRANAIADDIYDLFLMCMRYDFVYVHKYVYLCVVSQLFSNGSSLYFNNDMICDNPSNLIYPYSYYYNILTSFLETHTRRGSMCVPWVCNFDLFIISFQWKINYKNLEMFHVRSLSFIFRWW